MSTQVQLRRGTAAQHATFVGAPGEITVDTTNNTLRVHDGITPGGHPLTLQALFDAHLAETVQQAGGVHGLVIEAGTFTPILTGSAVGGNNSYSFRHGSYYRIGNLVHFKTGVVIGTKDTAMSGDVRFSGLPFTIQGTGGNYDGAIVGFFSNVTIDSGVTQLSALGIINTNYFNITQLGNTTSNLQSTAIRNGTDIRISGVYRLN